MRHDSLSLLLGMTSCEVFNRVVRQFRDAGFQILTVSALFREED